MFRTGLPIHFSEEPELYKDGLLPKTYQDFEQAIAGYTAGKIEAITVISRLKSLVDYELYNTPQKLDS